MVIAMNIAENMKQAKYIAGLLFFSAFYFSLAGCATYTFSEHVIPTLEYGAPEDVVVKKLNAPPGNDVYFLSGGHKYRYVTFDADTYRQYGFLFRDSRLDTVAETGIRWYTLYRRCTRFPLVELEDVDTDECFKAFITTMREDRIELKTFTAGAVNEVEKRNEHKTIGAPEVAHVATMAVIAPPLAAIEVGVGSAVVLANKGGNRKPDITPEKSLEPLLNSKLSDLSAETTDVPDDMRSTYKDKETLLIIGHFIDYTNVAIGTKSGLITWIDTNPQWTCGSEGLSCRLKNELKW